MSSSIIYEGWLKVKVTYPERICGQKVSAALSKRKPSVGKNEVAVRLRVELPIALFVTPQLEARIKVGDADVTPRVVDLEVKDNIEQIIQESTGFDVSLVTVDDDDA